jgi:AbiEi antitoxin C-terminal domain
VLLYLRYSQALNAFALAGYYRHCGWLDHVATVLSELVEVFDPEKLVTAAELSPITWVQLSPAAISHSSFSQAIFLQSACWLVRYGVFDQAISKHFTDSFIQFS